MDEEYPMSPQKILRSSHLDKINNKTSITCTKVPDGLFDAKAVHKHFSKFGKVVGIKLLPKKQMCIIEYDQQSSAERAVLNAGAYDGFMFDVTRTKPRVRRKSKKDDDPEWLPDPEVEEELNAMIGASSYKIRQKTMDVDAKKFLQKTVKPTISKKTSITTPKRTKPIVQKQTTSGIESPVLVTTTSTSLGIIEAATELNKLRSRISTTLDEKWRILDARDRILRAWGGAGSRVKIGGATIGTCPDMCPEKELLHRQAEHQVMTLETIIDSDGVLEPWRAVKQYSRSSADQEIPMCYELRPASVLMKTCTYLLHEIADTNRQVTLADWFHFMWDRFRGIRKDITQQALCCAESIRMVEICARFHAHCAARLADLEHTQFDQKLNTDNLTKCLQTLKHMYADVSSELKPNEAEFRGYIALLNLGDANFWWEIKQLPKDIQKSESITFAIEIYITLDTNNYVKFFRLIRERATYLQACILLRYFNDVRARALARIVKAYAPRGGSKYPAEDLLNILSFESIDSLKAFVNHYGLRFAKNEDELTIILNRNHFIEDSDPYPLSRAINVIESKRKSSVGEVISGGPLPQCDYSKHSLYTSFTSDGRLKETALLAEDIGYDTRNDSNKDVKALKLELQKLSQGRNFVVERQNEPKKSIFTKQDVVQKKISGANIFSKPTEENQPKLFQFQPAIPVAPTDVINSSQDKILEDNSKNTFTFSKPHKTEANVFASNLKGSLFMTSKTPFATESVDKQNVFGKANVSNASSTGNLFKTSESSDIFKKSSVTNSIFGQAVQNRLEDGPTNVFMSANTNIFAQKNSSSSTNLFTKANDNLFKINADNSENSKNIFGNSSQNQSSTNLFAFSKPANSSDNAFKSNSENKLPSYESHYNGSSEKTSPGSLFKTANQPLTEGNKYSIFQSKNKAQSVADSIFQSVSHPKDNIYDFDSNDGVTKVELPRVNEQDVLEENRRLEEIKKAEAKREQQRLEEVKRKQEELKKREELKQLEEKRKRDEEKKQEELKKKLEEEKRQEMKRKAEEEERKFNERVNNESSELVEEFINEIGKEEVKRMLTEENESFENLMNYACKTNEELLLELMLEMCGSEIKAITFRRKKLMARWYCVWRKHYMRNNKRRNLLECTPVWLPDKNLEEEAKYLRRTVEDAALKNMNAFHRGYKFTGELRQAPSPKPYNMLDLIRSPLLKRMKQIEYPYDKCFFWKASLISPGHNKYFHRQVNVESWLHDVFSDKKSHNVSDSLIYVNKHSWNNLMDFAISISLINETKLSIANEALNGANGLIFYITEKDTNCFNIIEQTLKHKYKYQILPIAVIIAKSEDSIIDNLDRNLALYKNKEIISEYKIFITERSQVEESLNTCTKHALKWLAKNYPKPPPLEIDHLKSICQRYLGNEIWCKLKSEKDSRTEVILKDLKKLITCYNKAVDKLTEVITDEDLFNYASFPLEFTNYLDNTSPYPKPYEFVTSNTKQSDNTSAIKLIMQKLKLPDPVSGFFPNGVKNMEDEIRKYCKQICWFSNPEEVVCKVVALLPNELTDVNMPSEEFNEYYESYDLIDLLNVIVYEKINSLNNFENRFAVYKKCVLDEYRSIDWLYEVEIYSRTKHKALEYIDDLDYVLDAKRRKIEFDKMEHLTLEDKDSTMVEQNIHMADRSISSYNSCKVAMSQLELKLNEEKKKSDELENLLRLALSNV